MSRIYEPEDNLLHEHDGDPNWQESHWFMWRAPGIGGLHRLALHPVTGMATFWCGVMTSEGTCYRDQAYGIPMAEQPANAFVVSPAQQLHFDEKGGVRILIDEPGCQVDLRYENHFPMARYLDREQMPTAGSPDHYEASGTVVGTVTIDGRVLEIDGVAFRDRSWGPRDYTHTLSHRWVAGTFGPDLSFSATGVAAIDGSYFTDGILIRDGKVVRAAKTDIVVHIEGDSFTHRGGRVVLTLPDGEDVAIDIETLDATMFTVGQNDSYAEIDSICVARNGDRVGFCDLEAGFNPRNGRDLPVLTLRANRETGLTKRDGWAERPDAIPVSRTAGNDDRA